MNRYHVLKNNLLALHSYHNKKVRLNSLPTYFWIEPTNHCNLNCIMCPNGAGKVDIKKGYMDFKLYKKIIDQIHGFASAVTLAVGGESLLHPKFIQMVRYAADNGLKVILNTNATLITKDLVRQLLGSGIDYISFAFDGFNKTSYEKTRVGARYETTINNILYFLREKYRLKKKKPYTILSILKLELEDISESEKQRFLSRFKGLVDEVRMREVSTWGKAFVGSKKFTFQKCSDQYLPCSRLWSTAVVTWNGDVVPCIYHFNHEYVIGNIHHSPFREIWNNNKIQRLRQAMLDNKHIKLSPSCEHCIVLNHPPVFGIPSGLRLTLADSMTNIAGFKFEKYALSVLNLARNKEFSAKTIQ